MSAYHGPKHPDANCEGCELYDQKYVPSHLDRNATIAVVGEAPGGMEVKTGIPFSGPSGQLLDQALKNANITTQVSKLNVVGCRPPANRTPTTDEIHRCEGRLHSELNSLPRLEQLVTLGNTATQTILDTKVGITKMRAGQPKEHSFYGEVIPTYHPAACLRTAATFPAFLNDIKKLRKDLRQAWKEPTYDVLDTPAEALDYLMPLLGANRRIVVDVEVGIEKDTDFGHPEHYQWLCVGFALDGNHATIIGEEALKADSVQVMIRAVIMGNKIICQNGKFDLAALECGQLWFDTMIASYVLDEAQGTHGLEYLSSELLGAPSWKGVLKPYLGPNKNYADVPRDVLYKYNAYDDVCTWLLYERFDQELTPKQRELHDNLCRVSMMLQHAEVQGLKIDMAHLDKLDADLTARLIILEERLKPFVDNPRSPKQVKQALHDLNVKVTSTNEKVLNVARRRATGRGQELIDGILEYRGEHKLHSTYVKGIRKRLRNGRIHPSFLVHGTTTGRLSSRNPNIQNQPRTGNIKKMYIPDSPEFVWVQADVKTAELRVVGIESRDPWLIEVLSDTTRDIHGEVADTWYGPGNWTKEDRVRAKAIVYGLSYGREAHSIAQEFNVPERKVEKEIAIFFDLMPGVVEWRNQLKHRVFKEGWDPTTHFGRTRRFHLITRENRVDVEKETYAFIPQSTANDICLLAATELFEDYGLDIRVLVHDSILVQCRPDVADSTATLMAKVMQDAAAKYYSDLIPFYIDTEIGTDWSMA